MPNSAGKRADRSESKVPVSNGAGGSRRASLSQDRSRQTRRRLVRAAVQLWTERGFEQGVEQTTVEEIARLAGVTKGTFYFHFASKNEVLHELGWGTAEALYEEAIRGSAAGRSGLTLLQQLLMSLARRAEAVPRAAVERSLIELYAREGPRPMPGRRDIHHGLAVALEAARVQGELPESTDTEEVARVLSAVVADALLGWAQGSGRRLRPLLRSRAAIVLAGVKATAGGSGHGPSRLKLAQPPPAAKRSVPKPRPEPGGRKGKPAAVRPR
jgi:AcrR family transcriptional regulator